MIGNLEEKAGRCEDGQIYTKDWSNISVHGRVFKVGAGQARMQTAGARDDLRSSVMTNEEGNKQAVSKQRRYKNYKRRRIFGPSALCLFYASLSLQILQ